MIDADMDRFGLMERIVRLAVANANPIAHLTPAQGMLNEAHPLAIGVYNGVSSLPLVRETIEDSDCLICVRTNGLSSHKINVTFTVELQAFKTKVDTAIFKRQIAADLLDGIFSKSSKHPSSFFNSSPAQHRNRARRRHTLGFTT